MTTTEKPQGPFKAYDLMTNEFLGGYDNPDMAYVKNPDTPITVIYRPSKKKAKARTFP